MFEQSMKCQNCESPIVPADERCPHCGAKPLHRRVTLGARRGEFALTPEEEPLEIDDRVETNDWQLSRDKDAAPIRGAQEQTHPIRTEVRWGGFFRRACAFLIDIVVILALWGVMFFLSYIGYKVGLSAHARAVKWERAAPLIFLLTWGSIGLATAYFVVFHGLAGKTIGKWLLGLRVIGDDQRSITYRRAFLRWLGLVIFAPLVIGLLWVLWSRQKRAWHDFMAHTWVIID
jgi:uncharacterized RDD family membrane protein YckC